MPDCRAAPDEVNVEAAENIQHHYSECRGGVRPIIRVEKSAYRQHLPALRCGLLLLTLLIEILHSFSLLSTTGGEKSPLILIWSTLLYQLGGGTPLQATGVKKGENNYRTAALTWKIARISPFQSHYKWDLIYGKTYLKKVLARL